MKKILAMLLAVLMLSGCSLAKPGESGMDQLTGFFVTVSRKDGDTIKDIWDEEAAGMEMISNLSLTGQRLYAQFIETPPTASYEFPEGCGLSCFGFLVEEEGADPYRASTVSPEIDAHMEYHVGDGESFRIDATVYGTKDTDVVIAVNPVYQTPDGSVYVLSDAPVTYDVATMVGCSTELAQKCGDGGESSYKLTICHVVLPETYVILEMDEENQILRQNAFAPGELPESYVPGTDAAYLILEARAGEDTIRTVYSPGDEGSVMDTFYPGDYGLCIKGYTRIDWEGAK